MFLFSSKVILNKEYYFNNNVIHPHKENNVQSIMINLFLNKSTKKKTNKQKLNNRKEKIQRTKQIQMQFVNFIFVFP